MRLPNLLVIGVSKAGTSSLFDWLGQHPDIGQSDTKEVRYFTPLRHGGVLEPISAYAQHFEGLTQRYAMEATPGYFYGGNLIARPMREICEAPRVVVSFREPISRCWSWFRFEKTRMRLPKDLRFDKYLDICEALHRDGLDGVEEAQPYWGLGGGTYDRWLDDWIDTIGLADLKVVFFDDLVSDPVTLVKGLIDWLGLDQVDLGDLTAQNVTQPVRVDLAQRLAVKVNRRGEQFFRRYPRVKRLLRSGYYAANRAEPEERMTPEDRARLEEFYRPHNERLTQQLHRLGLEAPWT